MTLSSIFTEIKSVSGKNDKLSILKENSENDALKLSCQLTYSPQIQFWMTAPKASFGSVSDGDLTLDILQDIQKDICGRLYTGNSAKLRVQNILENLSAPEAQALSNIINRDLDCGIGVGSINKVWPGLIPEFPVMLAEKNTQKNRDKFAKNLEKSGGPIMVQTKVDGGRFIYVTGQGGFSRGGNLLNVHGVFDYLDKEASGYVIDGELVQLSSSGGVESRQVGNGLYNKAVRGTISKEEASQLLFVVWDIIPIEVYFSESSKKPNRSDSTSNKIRFNVLKNLINYLNKSGHKNIKLVKNKEVQTLEEATEFYLSELNSGEEGAIIKDGGACWVNDRSISVIKMKAEIECTLRCVGTTPHEKKAGQIGSLVLESSCGELRVSVGSGLTDEDRMKSPESYLNCLVNIKYNSVIKSTNKSTNSLFLPIFMGIREDITEADSLSKLI